MKKIYIGTNTRGFLEHLFNYNPNKLRFLRKEGSYEIVSSKKLFLHKIAKSKLLSIFGFIHVIKVNNLSNDIDAVFSYNKLLKTNKPYYIYLENPYGLVNFSLERPNNKLVKKRLNKIFNDSNLKGIICASKACQDTIKKVYDIPNQVRIELLYPLISNSNRTFDEIENLKSSAKLKCLFIASRFRIKGGNEIISLMEKLEELQYNNIHLTMIVNKKLLDEENQKKINQLDNIEIKDFNLTYEELQEIYAQHDVLLNPTRMDSASLVTLEAIKQGVAVLASDLYAIPEMVRDNENGYLMSPKYRFFNYDNMPNPKVWNNRENTIETNYIDTALVDQMLEKIVYLNQNKDKLRNMQENSYLLGNQREFSSDILFKKWEKLFQDI